MPLKIPREFAPGLLEARSSEYLFCCLSEASGRLGFDHFALSYEPRARSPPVGNVLLHNYPADWADLYVSFDLAGHDPVRCVCDRRMRGFEWREVGVDCHRSENPQGSWSLFSLSADAGITSCPSR